VKQHPLLASSSSSLNLRCLCPCPGFLSRLSPCPLIWSLPVSSRPRDRSWSVSGSTKGRNEGKGVAAHLPCFFALLLLARRSSPPLFFAISTSHSDALARRALPSGAPASRGDPRGRTGRGRRVARCSWDQQSGAFRWARFFFLPLAQSFCSWLLFFSTSTSFLFSLSFASRALASALADRVASALTRGPQRERETRRKSLSRESKKLSEREKKSRHFDPSDDEVEKRGHLGMLFPLSQPPLGLSALFPAPAHPN